MTKEYHITFSLNTEEEGFKMASNQIQRQMKEGGAELISKNGEDEGYMDVVFHQYQSSEYISKLCNNILDKFKSSHLHISAVVCEHKPSVLLETKDIKNKDDFDKFVEELASKVGYISIEPDSKNSELIRIQFEKSSQRQTFQNDYTAKAGDYMKKGHSSVEIFPDWEDITILQKNNYKEPKRTTKYGY
jgi:hypothetical protein